MTRDLLVSVLVSVAAVVQLLPILGVFGTSALARLYGVTPTDATTSLLLRHRAVLLALVGVVLLAGAWWRPLQPLALGVGLTSKLSYLVLWKLTPGPTAEVTRVARIDLGSAALLAAAAVVGN